MTTVEGRPFRLLVDRSTITDGDTLQVLDALATLPNIECWFTTENGARWVEIDSATEVNDHIPVRLHAPGRLTHAALNPASTWRIRFETWAIPARPATIGRNATPVLPGLKLSVSWR